MEERKKRTISASLPEDCAGQDDGDKEDEVIGPMPVKAGPPAKKRKGKSLSIVSWLDRCYHQYTPCSNHNAIHCNVYNIQLHKSELLTNTFCFTMFNFFSSSSAAFWKSLLGQSSVCWDVREELHAQRHCHTCYLYKVSDISSLS